MAHRERTRLVRRKQQERQTPFQASGGKGVAPVERRVMLVEQLDEGASGEASQGEAANPKMFHVRLRRGWARAWKGKMPSQSRCSHWLVK